MEMVTRLAVLIGSQSPGNMYLPGVRADIQRMKQFLHSANGGAWHENEIIVLMNPVWQQVLQITASAIADYVLVYFSGHGCTLNNNRMLAVADGLVEDTRLLSPSPRQLVVIDACRTVVEGGTAIGAIPWYHDKWLHADGYSAARAIFNQYIMDSPYGKMIVHAARHGHSAFEGTGREGGQFTLALVDEVLYRQQERIYGPCFLPDILRVITQQLTAGLYPQQPEVAYTQGFLQVPLAVASPNFVQPRPRAVQAVPVRQQSNIGGWLIAAGLALAIYGLSD